MRKFRCPHCGEKSFNVFIPGSKSIGSGKFDRIRICPECDGRNRPNYNYKNIWLLSVYVLLFVSSIIIERFVDNSFVYLVGAGLFPVIYCGDVHQYLN